MVLAQGQILAIKLHDGLAAAGFITLAVTLTRYIDRADQIITATIYPAICAIQNQTQALRELYLKSNRATLMWVLPYAVGIVLFSPDLVHFVLGHTWQGGGRAPPGAGGRRRDHPARLQLVLVLPRPRQPPLPQALEATITTISFLVLAVGGLLVDGFDGFVIGRILAALIGLGVRSVFIARLLRQGPGVVDALAHRAATGVGHRRRAGGAGRAVGRPPPRSARRSPRSPCSRSPTWRWRSGGTGSCSARSRGPCGPAAPPRLRAPHGEPGYNPQAVRPRTERAIGERGLRPVIGDLRALGHRRGRGPPWRLPAARTAALTFRASNIRICTGPTSSRG